MRLTHTMGVLFHCGSRVFLTGRIQDIEYLGGGQPPMLSAVGWGFPRLEDPSMRRCGQDRGVRCNSEVLTPAMTSSLRI